MMTFDELWIELEKETSKISEQGILKRMLTTGGACRMFLGIERPSLSHVFMIQILKNSVPIKENIPESKGFELKIQISSEDADTHVTCIIRSTNKAYNEIFSAMSENMYDNLKNNDDEIKSASVFFKRIADWQLFFQKNNISGLTEESQRGLYGELLFIKEILVGKLKAPINQILNWTGPKSRQHDFQFTYAAIEVKTSSSKQHQKIFISNEQQLDESQVKNLFVYHVSLSILDNHIDTLPKLVNDVRTLIDTNLLIRSFFEECLIIRGYINAQAGRYQLTGYMVRESNLFHVTKEFPKIVEKNLPIGVGDVTYSIALSECKKYSVSFDALSPILDFKND